MSSVETLSLRVLKQQDDETTTRIITVLKDDQNFYRLSVMEGQGLMDRDKLDHEKLRQGVEYAIRNGTLPKKDVVLAPQRIGIMGKSSDDICNEILRAVRIHADESCGKIISLQGLSGTGKGTTVKKLSEKLSQTITWSNGNVFRCLAFCLLRDAMGATKGNSLERLREAEIDPAEINPSTISRCMSLLEFDFCPQQDSKAQNDTQPVCDIRIFPANPSDGPTLRVSDIQNTILKYPSVSRYVPLVAEKSQGEVIRFTLQALHTMTIDWKWNVLIEGRNETLNYIDTPHRFELVLGTDSLSSANALLLLGQRRAAQRVAAEFLRGRETTSLEDDVPKTAIVLAVNGLSA